MGKLKTFSWGDLDALVRLLGWLRSEEGEGWPVTRQTVTEWLEQPGLEPRENCFLLWLNDDLIGYLMVRPELSLGRTVLEMGTSPNHRDKDTILELLKNGVFRSRDLKSSLAHVCLPLGSPLARHLSGLGFAPIRRYWVMRWRGGELPAPQLPYGFAFRSFQPGEEDRLTQVQNAAFVDSWGFCANTVQQVRHRAAMSMCTPEGIIFLERGDEVVGYSWTCLWGEPPQAIGVIGMIGVTPSYRGKKLSRPLLLQGMHHLFQLGVKWIRLEVDAQNQPAVKLYKSVEFDRVMELQWFEACLSGGTGSLET